MAETRRIKLLDIYISSFLSLNGIEPTLEMSNGRVVFVFPPVDEVYRLMDDFNANVKVPIVDLVTTVKTLRGKMLSLKEITNEIGKTLVRAH